MKQEELYQLIKRQKDYLQIFRDCDAIKDSFIKADLEEISNQIDAFLKLLSADKKELGEKEIQNILALLPPVYLEIIDLNKTFQFSCGAHPILEKYNCNDLFGEDYVSVYLKKAPKLLEKIKEAFAGNLQIFQYQHKGKSSDMIAFPIQKENGKVEEVILFARRHKDMQRLKQKLQESEERYQQLADASFEAVFIFENEVCVNQNKTASILFGYLLEEVVGMRGSEFFHPDYRQEVDQKMKEGYEKPYEAVAIRKDGSTFDCEIQARMAYHKGRRIRVTAIRDITEKKETEERLKELEKDFKSIVELSPDGIIVLDLKGVIRQVNDGFVNLTGYRKEDFISKHFLDIPTLLPDKVESYRKLFTKVISGFFSKRPIIFHWQDKKGIIRTGEAVVTLIKRGIKITGIQGIIRDVTEQTQAINALKESETRYRNIFYYSPLGVLHYDKKGIITDCNDYFVQIIGSSKKVLVGLNMLTQLNDQKIMKQVAKSLKDGEGYYEDVYTSVTADKSTFVRILFRGIKDKDGRISSGMGLVEDITDRKKAEKELKIAKNRAEKNAAKSNSLLSAIPDMMFVFDKEGYIVDFHAEKKDNLYTDPTVFLNKKVEDVLPDHIAEITYRNINKVLTTKSVHEYHYSLEIGGKEKQYDTRMVYLDENQTIAIVRDITESKEAKIALERSEERYRSLFEQAADGILIGNVKGVIVNANKSICRISGYKKDELIGSNIKMLFPDDVLNDKPLRYDLVLTGEAVLSERNLRRKDGNTITIEMNTRKVGDGRLQAYIRDVSERKKAEQRIAEQNQELMVAEEELKVSNEDLRHLNEKLKQQAEMLKIAKDKAEESDRLKSAFLANMSHEIRTPMNGILGFADLMRTSGLEDPKMLRYIDVIQQSGQRMLNIVNDLIDISKIEAGQAEVSMEIFSLNSLMESLVAFFQPEFDKKGLQASLHLGLADQENSIQSDKTKLSQVLTNLIKNAIKFTDEGKIQIGYERRGRYLYFYVSDTGIGIIESKKDLIFERFRQVVESGTSPYEGTGLGLSISKAFVEMLGGEIGFESKTSEGSLFYFTIPYHAASLKNQHNNLENYESLFDKEITILLVEDDETSRLYLKELLERYNCHVFYAENGQTAIDMVEKNKDIQLILMDIKMPVKDGYVATREIKKMRPDLPLIVQTAYAMDSDHEKAMEAGCDDYISKPINPDDLYKLISKYIQS